MTHAHRKKNRVSVFNNHSLNTSAPFNNRAYLFSIKDTRQVLLERDGNVKATRWCVGCHDPVPFFTWKFDNPNMTSSTTPPRALESPARSITPSLTWTARAGIRPSQLKNALITPSHGANTPSFAKSTTSSCIYLDHWRRRVGVQDWDACHFN